MEKPQACRVCKDLIPNGERAGTFSLTTTRGKMKKSAGAGCRACAMIIECTKHWSSSFEDTDEMRFAEGLVVHGARLGQGVRIHTLIGDQDCPWEVVQKGGVPMEHPTLDDYVAFIKGKFHICATKHEACVRASSAIGKTQFQPMRLLEILDDGVRVVEPAKDPTKYGGKPYIALSHCWGCDPVPTKTTRKNLPERKQIVPWEELTRTFQDVMTLARRLGVSLVWIDSLCIVQDDAADWAHEASQMASVYQHAYLTVAATAASNGSVGLFLPRLPVYKYESKPVQPETSSTDSAQGADPFTVYARPVLDHTPFRRPSRGTTRDGGLPLLTRGWCFQEQLLSTRVVHFTAEELVWDCFAGVHCECAQNDGYDMKKRLGLAVGMTTVRGEADTEGPVLFRRKKLHDQLSKAWCDAIEQYTYRSLTFVQDRLAALSGLAALFEQLGTGNRESIGSTAVQQPSSSVLGAYLAGLWEKDMPFCLLWVSKYGEGQRPKQPLTSATDAPHSSPPTWSWASVDGRVISFQRWNPPTADNTRGLTETISTITFPSTTDQRGIVSGGRLTLRGPVAKLSLQQFLIKPETGNNNGYSYMQYILTHDETGPLFPGGEEGETGSHQEETTVLKALSKEVPFPEPMWALQPDVPLDPSLNTVWFLNLTVTMSPPTQSLPKGRRYLSGIFLQHAGSAKTRTPAVSSGGRPTEARPAFPLFQRVGVGALLKCEGFDQHSSTATVTIV